MLKKTACTLLAACALFSGSSLAATHHELAPGITVEYDLPPNSPQVFSNYFFWTVTATCVMHSEDPSNNILVKALSKSGKINGMPLTKGQQTVITIHNRDHIEISADSGAQVELTNYGPHTVKATCST
ncbi:hypothetical protein DIZ81_13710 [Legionella taurinensis]|uniref:Uncharacterized protein n=1 Tax=Legionella taurinensis TaxID=70611 RepID=A0A3A5L4L4_9GAMM|nr:hypothetical protein [Legionella taurinensis]MDX1838824.1 hypothetical protein [Legionella taurinensis]PUT38587.1 hypothetical protein DB744_13720 [Legionella taurinensis]PUT39496.1 hypothetical protein DB746_13730 [Legionella taurinensis]PUT41632.1 hypothetical protein DB743_13700 [Legionella taurinensis]PUT44999.1 hypothetical protein DB745_13670 [Legionella taurinensis]